jgi:hypothetical protein
MNRVNTWANGTRGHVQIVVSQAARAVREKDGGGAIAGKGGASFVGRRVDDGTNVLSASTSDSPCSLESKPTGRRSLSRPGRRVSPVGASDAPSSASNDRQRPWRPGSRCGMVRFMSFPHFFMIPPLRLPASLTPVRVRVTPGLFSLEVRPRTPVTQWPTSQFCVSFR